MRVNTLADNNATAYTINRMTIRSCKSERNKEAGEGIVKLFKLLLSLDSLRLVAISAVVITYLAMTTASSSHKTEAVKEKINPIVSEESTRLTLDDAESLEAKMEMNAIVLQLPDHNNEGR